MQPAPIGALRHDQRIEVDDDLGGAIDPQAGRCRHERGAQGCLDVHPLGLELLQPVQDQFPATLGLLLHMPTPEVDPHRDGISVPKVLQFTDVVDLLSAEELECVSPGLHRGWEDRRFSCRRSRATAQTAIGVTLQSDDQAQLLLLAAYRNRLFRCPPPVRVVPGKIIPAFDRLEWLVESLLEPTERTPGD